MWLLLSLVTFLVGMNYSMFLRLRNAEKSIDELIKWANDQYARHYAVRGIHLEVPSNER
jgi:hypothetical protein